MSAFLMPYKRYTREDSKSFSRFLRYTNEKEVFANAIIRTIRPRSDWSFLDVGCGTGSVTIPIARRVGSTVALDSSSALLEEAKRNASGIKGIRFVCQNLLRASGIGRYDMVLASYVLHSVYLNDRVEDAIDMLLRHVKDRGYLVIVSPSEEDGYSDMMRRFWVSVREQGGKSANSGDTFHGYRFIAGYLRKLGYPVKAKRLSTRIELPAGKETLSAVRFFFGVPYGRLSQGLQKEMRDYFATLTRDGKVIISQTPYLLYLKKQ